jgi:hypothetical protein
MALRQCWRSDSDVAQSQHHRGLTLLTLVGSSYGASCAIPMAQRDGCANASCALFILAANLLSHQMTGMVHIGNAD